MNKNIANYEFWFRLKCIISTPGPALALYIWIIPLKELKDFTKCKSENMNNFSLLWKAVNCKMQFKQLLCYLTNASWIVLQMFYDVFVSLENFRLQKCHKTHAFYLTIAFCKCLKLFSWIWKAVDYKIVIKTHIFVTNAFW